MDARHRKLRVPRKLREHVSLKRKIGRAAAAALRPCLDRQTPAIGKPDLKPNAQTVNETLAALAGLRVDHYALDRDADLNLYGLEPSEWVLEIEGPTGKRVLQLGRAEGDSKRRYARVPEKGRAGVFVIAEADAERILRDPAAFTREPKGADKPVP